MHFTSTRALENQIVSLVISPITTREKHKKRGESYLESLLQLKRMEIEGIILVIVREFSTFKVISEESKALCIPNINVFIYI